MSLRYFLVSLWSLCLCVVILHLSSVVLCLFVVVVVYVVILNVSLWSVCVSFRYFLVSLQSFFKIFLCVFLCHYLVIFFSL